MTTRQHGLVPGADGHPAAGRRATIRDVAAAAGVSKSLVSLVYAAPASVSDQRRRRVLAAAERLGFRPNQAARSLAAADGGFVGILVADLHNPVFAELVDAARDEFATHGTTALVTTATLSSASSGGTLDHAGLRLFGDLRPSGLLVAGSVPDIAGLTHVSPGRPIVIASGMAQDSPGIRVVRGDDDLGIRMLVDHLVDLGHEDIAHIGGEGGAVASLRARAYREAMAERGLTERARTVPSDFSAAGGRRAAEELLGLGRPPTAIVAVNDLAGVGALSAARARRAHVAVTGYDNTFVSALEPISLTTVDPHSADIGRTAARLFEAPGGALETLIVPTLVARGSTSGGSW